jgi:arsenic resistance protein ArsH
MKESLMRERLVDCMEEFVKYIIVMRPHLEGFGDRFSERRERERKEEKVKREEEGVKEGDGDVLTGMVNGVDLGRI